LPEVLALADRILIMRHGRLTGELTRAEATEEKVMHLAAIGTATTAVETHGNAKET
jgi:ABC-type sugar transport system ATPase subunit